MRRRELAVVRTRSAVTSALFIALVIALAMPETALWVVPVFMAVSAILLSATYQVRFLRLITLEERMRRKFLADQRYLALARGAAPRTEVHQLAS